MRYRSPRGGTHPRLLCCLSALALAAAAPAAYGTEFGFGDDAHLSWNNRVSIGGAWRLEDRDPDLIGKLNLNPNLCDGDDCRDFGGDPEPNLRLVRAPGGLAAHNQDNGNLNYDKHDTVFATARWTTDLKFTWGELGLNLRGLGIFDEVNTDFTEKHPNTRYQPAETKRSKRVEDIVGRRAELLDAYVTYPLTLGERVFHLSVGEQRIRWGEANTIQLNSIGEINPIDANFLVFPGAELADIFLPAGLAMLSTDLTDNLALEVIYQYRWAPTEAPAFGSFLSTSDGLAGGEYAVLAEGQASEDPQFIGTPAGTLGLISSSSYSVPIMPEDFGAARDGGQYGFSLRGYLPDFMHGTELAFYALNYHSRLPYLSMISADASCWRDSANFAEATVDCQGFNGSLNPTGFGLEPVPLDTARVVVDYPEDIHMFGVSFNTTVGLWSLAGEYSYRPNLPLLVQQQDTVFAAVNPIFPRQELVIPGVATIPTAAIAAPDYLETRYRGNPDIQPNTLIRGYERQKVGQLSLTGIRVLSRTANPIGADQIILLVEAGFTHVLDMPDLDELQFDGGGADATHYSPGADGSGDGVVETRRTVPTMQTDGFADDFAGGYRVLARLEYNNLVEWIPVVRPMFAFFHDVKGVAPRPMQNFVEGRKQLVLGSGFEFTQRLSGQLLYTAFAGGGSLNTMSDRDFLSLYLAYSF